MRALVGKTWPASRKSCEMRQTFLVALRTTSKAGRATTDPRSMPDAVPALRRKSDFRIDQRPGRQGDEKTRAPRRTAAARRLGRGLPLDRDTGCDRLLGRTTR